MPTLPDRLTPTPGARGLATDGRADLSRRVADAWDLLAEFADSADLEQPARGKGRTGLEVLVPAGRWTDSRGMADVVADAQEGRTHRIDQDAYERALRLAHRGASAAEVVDALRAARAEVAAWLGSAEDDAEGLGLTASPLGALPIRTLCHAAVYQLAVLALDLEPCSPEPVPAELLELGLAALVDSTGCLAARRELAASLVADSRDVAAEADQGRVGGSVWGFGTVGGDWVAAPLDEPEGPTVTASTRAIIDITSGRTANVPGLVRSGDLRLHDVPGLLRLAPLVDEVPGIPGAGALRAATTSLGVASNILGRLGRLRPARADGA